MACYLVDAADRRLGPYQPGELLRLHQQGALPEDCRVLRPGDPEPVDFGEFLRAPAGSLPAPAPSHPRTAVPAVVPPAPLPAAGATTAQALRRLLPHLMLPLEDLRRLPARENFRIVALATIGLVPLALGVLYGFNQDVAGVYWGLALYVCGLWALLFYGIFRQPEITLGRSLLCLFGTAFVSVALLRWPIRALLPDATVKVWTQDPSPLVSWGAWVVGVGLPEELVKLTMLYFLTPARPRPQAMLFYGMICGLGFALTEVLGYQWRENLASALQEANAVFAKTGSQEEAVRTFASLYYIANFLRVTSLPFLHALWSGIAGYFLGWALHAPQHRTALFIVALAVPAVLHGTYNMTTLAPAALAVGLVSVVALNLYLLKSGDFERLLRTHTPAEQR